MLSNASRFRRTAAGLSLIAAPLLLLVGDLVGTRGPTNRGDFLAAVARRPAADEAGIVLAVYGFALMLPAVAGLMHLLRHRAVALGHVGGALVVLGLVSFAFVAGTEILYVAGADPAADRDEVLALDERIGGSVGYNIINATELIGYFLGFVLLAVALVRARVVPRGVSALLVAALILRILPAASLAGVVLADALMLAALAYVGLTILRQSDEEWERPPERGTGVRMPS